jgi:hypothetical protein
MDGPIRLATAAILLVAISCATVDSTNARRSQYVFSHLELPEMTKGDILDGRIRIGMAREHVRASWGEPDDIRVHADASGVVEVWVYFQEPNPLTTPGLTAESLQWLAEYQLATGYRRKAMYLQFTNGILVKFGNSI